MLARLSNDLQRFLGNRSPSFRAIQLQRLLVFQQKDGGFRGRDGASDLYYTRFAARLLEGFAETQPLAAIAAYLRRYPLKTLSLVDAFCFADTLAVLDRFDLSIRPAKDQDTFRHRLQKVLDAHRCETGGYGRAPGSPASLYYTFLGLLLQRHLSAVSDAHHQALSVDRRLVSSRQTSDGGFSDLGTQTAGQTNATAAALGILTLCGVRLRAIASIRPALRFLVAMQREDGGFASSAAAPASDLLSTFTAVVALDSAGNRAYARKEVLHYARRLAQPHGGYGATQEDPGDDVEYMYYGLGLFALLRSDTPKTS